MPAHASGAHRGEAKDGEEKRGRDQVELQVLGYIALITQLADALLWCSGYHVRLTRERSLVRSQLGVAFLYFSHAVRP